MPHDLARIAYWMAIAFLAVAVAMTSTVGWRFGGPLLAFGLAIITIAAAILPTYAHHAWNEGHRATGVAIGIAAAIFGVAEYVSHVSYAVTHRTTEVETVSHAGTAYDDTRATIASLAAKEKALDAQARWESRSLPDVVADIEKAKLNRRWTSTAECTDATATASRAFCASYASLLAEKANAEEAATIRAELDAVRKELATARLTAEGKAPGVSMASTTDTLVAQMVSFSLDPSEDTRQATGIGIVSWLALAFASGAALFWFLAHMPAAHGAAGHAIAHPEPAAQPAPTPAQQLAAKAQQMRQEMAAYGILPGRPGVAATSLGMVGSDRLAKALKAA